MPKGFHAMARSTAAGLTALFVSSATSSWAASATERLQLEINKQSGLITLKGDDVPVSAILARLAEAGIEVLAPDVPDRNVTVSMSAQTLPAVLDRIFPPGTHYWIRGGQEDRVVPGSGGDKPGRTSARPTNAPRKGAPGTLPPLKQGGDKKPPVETPSAAATPPPEGGKLPPRAKDLPPRSGAKIAKPPSVVDGRYVRLHLTMSSDGKIELRDALVLEGDLVSDEGLLGEYVYSLESAGGTLATGSFADPLEQHAYLKDPDRPHEVLRAKSGEFNVSLPGSAVDARVLGAARLVFYRLTGPPPEPGLTTESFQKMRSALRQVQVVEGAELAKRLLASRQ
jgi:hypothetical protein